MQCGVALSIRPTGVHEPLLLHGSWPEAVEQFGELGSWD